MKTMEDCKFKNMSDLNLARFLRDYAKTRGGELRSLTLAAADRILDLKDKIKKMEDEIARGEDDGK
ncbi:MAG: hypothetical protein K6G83_15915 [Lachnospiraceae bacterium]|nr:hypothetical protein [Lachnospiraceae bacterium]